VPPGGRKSPQASGAETVDSEGAELEAVVILPFGYPQEGSADPDTGVLVAFSEFWRPGTRSDLRRDFGEEYEESWSQDCVWSALVRELFPIRRHNGLPLLRGRLLWEAMTWEPGDPINPTDLLACGNRSDETKAETRDKAKVYARSNSSRYRKRQRRIRAGRGGVSRQSLESKASLNRLFTRREG
jgi:hypothetical protein